jgi:hypothetical protein
MAKPLPPSGKNEPLPKEMLELCNAVGQLPLAQRNKLGPLCERVGHLLQLQSRLLRISQDTVDQLQLDVKYLLFDLEVTRKERNAFKHELENR